MRAVLQRVQEASVDVGGERIASIQKGLLVLLGLTHGDTLEDGEALLKKMTNLRIFEDDKGKMNLSLLDIQGQLLLVSQFTLYANCTRGRRPSFTDAMPPGEAEPLFEQIVQKAQTLVLDVQKGQFGAEMKVHLLNDGPVTILLES